MTLEEAKALAAEILAGRTRSYVGGAKRLAEFVAAIKPCRLCDGSKVTPYTKETCYLCAEDDDA